MNEQESKKRLMLQRITFLTIIASSAMIGELLFIGTYIVAVLGGYRGFVGCNSWQFFFRVSELILMGVLLYPLRYGKVTADVTFVFCSHCMKLLLLFYLLRC